MRPGWPPSSAHPAIVAVYDIGRQQDGSIYIVLEYVDGQPLSEVLKAGDFRSND